MASSDTQFVENLKVSHSTMWLLSYIKSSSRLVEYPTAAAHPH